LKQNLRNKDEEITALKQMFEKFKLSSESQITDLKIQNEEVCIFNSESG